MFLPSFLPTGSVASLGWAWVRREGLELAPLLERHSPRAAYHLPLFTAVVHNYPGMLQRLLGHGLALTPAITTEHMEVAPLPARHGLDCHADDICVASIDTPFLASADSGGDESDAMASFAPC